MELRQRKGVTRWLFVGLAIGVAPVLSRCANFELFPAQASVSPAPPVEMAVATEPASQPQFPELAVEPQSFDLPRMADETPEVSDPPAPRQAAGTRPTPTRRPAAPRQASLQPPAPSPAPPPSPAPRTVEPADLVGFNFDSVLEVLRQPDAVEKNALSVVWTYAGSECTLQLYFYPDIQTAVFRLLKYELKANSGEKLTGGSACLQPMMASKDGSQFRR